MCNYTHYIDTSKNIGYIIYMKYDIKELKFDIEMIFASACCDAEDAAKESGEEYKCTCPDPYSWTDEEVLAFLGLD